MDNFKSFDLDSNIYKAITACGYTAPTPVQAKSIPQVLLGNDVVVSAQTGTGKTAAFVLPALHNLSLKEMTRKTRVLILTPTRELASQITKAASMYGKFLRFNIVSLVGGMPYHGQIKDLSRGADIIVATPGRLIDHMEQKRVDLSHVEMLVLDEADRMLDMGFIDDVQHIAQMTPAKRQTLLFSATMDNKLMHAVKHLLRNPVRIDLSSQKLTAPKIKQEMYRANNSQHKTRLLKHFLNDENIFKAIIFSATKMNAERLATTLRDDGFSAAALHGDLRQNVRTRTLEQLRRGKIQFLVATDVAARGIDVSDITHVINYDLPRFCEDYVHRIGRTGRAGKDGTAISFVLPSESRNLNSIERYIGQRIQLINNLEIDENAEPKNRNYVPEVIGFKKDRKFGGGHGRHQSEQRQDRFVRGSERDHEYADEKHEKPRKFDSKKSDFSKKSEFPRKSEFAKKSEFPRKSEFRGNDARKSEFRGGDSRKSEFRNDSRDSRKSEFRGGDSRSESRGNFRSDSRDSRDSRKSDFRGGDSRKPEFRSDSRKSDFRSSDSRSESRGNFRSDSRGDSRSDSRSDFRKPASRNGDSRPESRDGDFKKGGFKKGGFKKRSIESESTGFRKSDSRDFKKSKGSEQRSSSSASPFAKKKRPNAERRSFSNDRDGRGR